MFIAACAYRGEVIALDDYGRLWRFEQSSPVELVMVHSVEDSDPVSGVPAVVELKREWRGK